MEVLDYQGIFAALTAHHSTTRSSFASVPPRPSLESDWMNDFSKMTKTVFTRTELRHTPRYSIRSGPICPYFQMTTFKAKNVFLVLGMGHNMNKLTYEYKKTQFYNNLVDLQCKCMRLDTPRIGPIWGFLAVK